MWQTLAVCKRRQRRKLSDHRPASQQVTWTHCVHGGWLLSSWFACGGWLPDLRRAAPWTSHGDGERWCNLVESRPAWRRKKHPTVSKSPSTPERPDAMTSCTSIQQPINVVMHVDDDVDVPGLWQMALLVAVLTRKPSWRKGMRATAMRVWRPLAKTSTADQRYAISYWWSVITVAALLTVCEIFSRVEVENRLFLPLYCDCRPLAEKCPTIST